MAPIGLLPLAFLARHGRACLVAGLVAGFLFPSAAVAVKPWLPELVALLVFTAAFRIGPAGAWAGARGLSAALVTVGTYQVALPLLALALFAALGVATTPFALAAVLMFAAPSISGSPNLAILAGADPAPALRLMIIGTALFPLTVIPTLLASPQLGGADVMVAAARLFATIAAATLLAFAARRVLAPDLTPVGREALDGLGAALMAIAVVGLMAALSPGIRSDPADALRWIGAAFALNIGLQLAAFHIWREGDERVPRAIIAGNRNVALFLVALPPQITDPILIFIGAYQLPMYLTPVLMGPLYRRTARPFRQRG